MTNKDWAEEIKRLYFEGYDLTEATKKVLKMATADEKMEIRELVQKAHTNAREKGFWQDYDRALDLQNENNAIATRLMLIVSELSEALEKNAKAWQGWTEGGDGK